MLLHWFSLLGFKSLFYGELRVFIHPQRVVLLHLTRPLKNGFRQQVVYKQVIDIPHKVLSLEVNQHAISSHVEIIRQILTSKKWLGVVPTVIFDNYFVRYAVIPWSAELAKKSERQAYLQHYFHLVYGDAAKALDCRMSAPAFGKSTIASAIHSNLLQALHGVFGEVGMKLAGVHPQLMLAINQTVSQIKVHNKNLYFWLVAIQNGRLCLTFLENGGWRLVKNVAIEVDVSEQVSALIQREKVNANVTFEAPVLLYWPESQHAQPLTLANHRTVKILPHLFDMQNCVVPNASKNLVSA